MTRIRGILTVVILLIPVCGLPAARPLAAVAGVSANSPRTLKMSLLLETHLNNILYSTGIFDTVNHTLLKRELGKFSCTGEKCILRFALNAGMSLVIRGDIDDRGSKLVLRLRAFGTGEPFNGECVYSYSATVPMTGRYDSREYSYIGEEHAGYFVSGVLENFMLPVYLKKGKSGKTVPDTDLDVNGQYGLFRYEKGSMPGQIRPVVKIGKVRIKEGSVVPGKGMFKGVLDGDFIYIRFRDRARFLSEFYYGRKREIVLTESSWEDTVYAVLLTVPASAAMPVVAPLIGYYQNGDWAGLTLWGVNAAPYLYCEYQGLSNRAQDLRDNREDLSRNTLAMSRFGAYMFLAGGVSLFVDAFAWQYNSDAAAYSSIKPVIGNNLTAAYLSIIAGGAGHFYRGNRFWGYLYFHLDNILLYLAIREFSPPERYESATDSYSRGSVNRPRAWTMAGVFGLVKIVELFHVLGTRDSIRNGKVEYESVEPEPVIYGDPDSGVSMGFQLRKRF